MFAILKTGGKQYKVSAGETISIEKIKGEIGQNITLEKALAFSEENPTMHSSPCTVEAIIKSQFRDKKIIVFKKKRRKDYRRKKGHKQHLTEIQITDIKS